MTKSKQDPRATLMIDYGPINFKCNTYDLQGPIATLMIDQDPIMLECNTYDWAWPNKVLSATLMINQCLIKV